MKKMLIMLLVLVLLPFDSLLAAKKDNQGENLNFAPFVDFELKEKKKVDVIVDVGNTKYTEAQVNSLVNESLRPELQASGLDYKIHVEKSSEGATKLYYVVAPDATIAKTEAEIRVYDIVTGEDKLVKKLIGNPYYYYYRDFGTWYRWEIATGITANQVTRIGSSLYDPSKEILYFNGSTGTFGYDIINDEFFVPSPGSFGTHSDIGSIIVSETDYVYAPTKSANGNGYDYGHGAIKITRDENNQLVFEDFQFLSGSIGTRIIGTDGYIFHLNQYVSGSTVEYTWNARNYFTNLSTRMSGGSGTSNVGVNATVSSAPGFTVFIERQTRGSANYLLKMFDHDSKKTTTLTDGLGSASGYFFAIEDGRIFYQKNNKQYVIEDRFNPTETTKELAKTIQVDQTNPLRMGNYIINYNRNLNTSPYRMSTTITNLDTLESKTVMETSSNNYQLHSLAPYPAWYSAKKRHIVDILDEVPYRADADKYYIRLDDYSIPHLDNVPKYGETIQALAKQNITYIGIGNDYNKKYTDNIKAALGKGMFYSIEQATQSLKTASTYITERKEVDLHVLIGSSTYTLAQIKTQVNELSTQLSAKNIYVTPHYVQGNSTSHFQALLNEVNWSEEKNNYLFLVQNGMMEDMKSELAQEEVVQLLGGNYAHLLWLGANANTTLGNQMITLLEGNGLYDGGSTLPTYINKAVAYIEQSAVLNPKRVHNVLVLKHDPLTGEYSSEISVETFYEDFEADKQRNERFKTMHDPTVYENHTGVMEGIGLYQELPTTRFTKVGLYEMVVQVQDEPIADPNLSEYWLWSKDSMSRLMLYVHRQPIAEFSATVNASRRLTVTDYSYDLDRYSRLNRGITTWEWKWKKVDDEAWTAGQAPATLAANTDYLVSLKVKDIDGAWSNETIRFVTTNPYNQPPVSLFTVDPASISHRATSTITDHSYDPDGDAITERTWIVTKDGVEIWNSGSQPTSAQLQTAAQSMSLDKLGSYRLQLRVKDAPGLWSPWYSQYLEVVNYAPIANFEPLTETYRDTLNTVLNLTANPDLDGDPVSYQWQLNYNGKGYNQGTAKDASFTIKSKGLGKAAVGTWNLQLKATDSLGAFSYMSYDFDVLNQVPITQITSGRDTGYINEPYSYTSSRMDADSEDIASLQSYWKLTSPSGRVTQWDTQSISITYDEKGEYRLDNWVVDQLGAKSEVKTMYVRVLNMLPIPGFTMNPNPTYRGTSIDIVSQATDLDGYIDKHAYFVTLPNGTTTMVSESGDFKRAFSTLGTIKVRQTVTDNDGAIAGLEKILTIMNHPPTVQIITPTASSPNTPTVFQSVTPRIHWTMSDIEQDPQTMYQLTLKTADNQPLYTTNHVSSRNAYFDIPSSWRLQENTVYAVTVSVYDGYDWSVPSAPKYFIVQLNHAPDPGFSWMPSIVWEGDAVSIRHAVTDPDQDQLTVTYSVRAPTGATLQYPSNGGSYLVAPSNYTSHAFTLSNVAVGAYTITQTITDGKSEAVRLSQTIHVGQLSVLGQVRHTDLWESYRNEFNEKANQSGRDIWLPEQFYAGEKFILSAITTDTKSTSNEQTYVNKVTATFNGKYMTELQHIGEHKWSAELWHTDFTALAKGTYPILFTATYSNGIVKTHQIEVEIIGNANTFVSVHRWK